MNEVIIYEHEDTRQKVISFSKGYLRLVRVHPYLLWLEFSTDKPLLTLWLTGHQVARLGKYLSKGKWEGGFTMCPNGPSLCTIHGISTLPGRSERGLILCLNGKPHMEIEWIPEDPLGTGYDLLKWAGEAYRQREMFKLPEPPPPDLEAWKKGLFEIARQ